MLKSVKRDNPLKYLIRQHKTWYLKRRVPRDLLHLYGGKTFIVESLHTHSILKARKLRDDRLIELERQFLNARHDAESVREAELNELESKWQKKIRRDNWGLNEPMTAKEKAEFAKDRKRALSLGSKRVAESLGKPAPRGRPLDYLESQFFSERKITERTKTHYRKTRKVFEEFLESEGLPVTLESVTKPVALAFQSWLVAEDFHPVTGNAYIGGLRSRFNYLINKMAVEGPNPFQGVLLKAPNTGEEPSRREWRGPELKTLFAAESEAEQFDLMAAGLLLGARRAEVVGFKVKDYRSGWLHVTKGKSRAAIRKIAVPKLIRPALTRIVAGLKPDDYIFLRSKSDVTIHTRGNLCGQRFERFRKSLGLTNDATVYHSLRHTFMTLADESRPRHHVRAVVGHSDKKDVTAGYTRVSDRNRVRVMQAVLKGIPAEVRKVIASHFGR